MRELFSFRGICLNVHESSFFSNEFVFFSAPAPRCRVLSKPFVIARYEFARYEIVTNLSMYELNISAQRIVFIKLNMVSIKMNRAT